MYSFFGSPESRQQRFECKKTSSQPGQATPPATKATSTALAPLPPPRPPPAGRRRPGSWTTNPSRAAARRTLRERHVRGSGLRDILRCLDVPHRERQPGRTVRFQRERHGRWRGGMNCPRSCTVPYRGLVHEGQGVSHTSDNKAMPCPGNSAIFEFAQVGARPTARTAKGLRCSFAGFSFVGAF